MIIESVQEASKALGMLRSTLMQAGKVAGSGVVAGAITGGGGSSLAHDIGSTSSTTEPQSSTSGGGEDNIETEFEKLEPSKKSLIKSAQLPSQGKIRYLPPENWTPSQPLPRQAGGYVDKFGNIWTKGPSRTTGQAFEWDVQLSHTGKSKLGWLSRDGQHINVSLDGIITHK